jgi:hypothetical protein
MYKLINQQGGKEMTNYRIEELESNGKKAVYIAVENEAVALNNAQANQLRGAVKSGNEMLITATVLVLLAANKKEARN